MPETIGQKLQQKRREKRLSIVQASQATRIRPHYLEAIERDDLSAIPSAPQARGFLRLYADFLGVNPDDFSQQTRPASSPEVSAAPVQAASPAPERSSLLDNLRERFTRRPQPENINPIAEESPAPEPEFIPARHTEELPAAPEAIVVEEPIVEEKTKPVKRTSTRKPAARKTSAKPKAAKKSTVKKKITDSRPKKKSVQTKRG